jgi:superfamily II DNA or RNA helicase
MREQEIIDSLHTGFIDSSKESLSKYRPTLVVNNKYDFPNEKIITTFLDELNHCKSYMFSVAFITSGGIAPLLTTLKNLDEKGIKGKILTGTYLGFTQPEPLRVLDTLKNTEVRLIDEDFHAKGYVFEHEDFSTIIIGSANLTQSALASTIEWNMKLASLENGAILTNLETRFKNVWDKAKPIVEIIDEYEKWFIEKDGLHRFLHPVKHNQKIKNIDGSMTPNKMQIDTLARLDNLRTISKQNKALVVAATGTGKTILAALDVNNFKPNKMLFVVHRENVAKTSLEVFKMVLGGNENDYGMLSGKNKSFNKKYTFATIQTLNNESIYKSFKRDEFDYIILDEAHHTAAENWYGGIMEYFQPKFLLGLTATPNRMDNADIFKKFDFNLASNVNLNDALKADLLVPFHYYGIAELKIDNKEISDKSKFSQLTSDDRVEHIIKSIKFYTMCRKQIKGLVFCRNLEEAECLSKKFANFPYSYKTIWLSGANDADEREEAKKGLKAGSYDLIFTYDIFNEGVDIPPVDLVVMLRPTKSSIVFIQQLGRGLRKYKYKEYLTVLDFIGNYDNNFLIPAALSSSKTYSKSELREGLTHPETMVYGDSSVSFDTISRKRIFNAIDKNYKNKFLQDEYFAMKKIVGRVPTLMDFINNNAISPLLFIDRAKSYWNFKIKVEDDIIDFEEGSLYKNSLYGLSKYIANGVKKFDLIFLKGLIKDNTFELNEASLTPSENTTIRMFGNQFYRGTDPKLFGNIRYCDYKNDKVTISKQFRDMLNNQTYYNEVVDLLNLAIEYNNQIKPVDELGFELYKSYRRDEIFKILGAKKDMTSTSMGYIYVEEINAYPIFVTLHKDKKAQEDSLDFEDEFIDNKTFKWQSTINEGLKSKRSQGIINFKQNNTSIYLFVRKWKNNNERKFHYIGKVSEIKEKSEGKKWYALHHEYVPITNLKFEIEPPVNEKFLTYLVDLDNV